MNYLLGLITGAIGSFIVNAAMHSPKCAEFLGKACTFVN